VIGLPQTAIDLAKRFQRFCRVTKLDPHRAYPHLGPGGSRAIGCGRLCNAERPPINMKAGEADLAADMVDALNATVCNCPLVATEPEEWLMAILYFIFNFGAGRFSEAPHHRKDSHPILPEFWLSQRRYFHGFPPWLLFESICL